ncbi:MAG TPA: hypothetical protein ACFYD2_01580 [Candidatus Avalokitesvara rifleensis]|uniref:hypothetical protein n=1 Tax=Candidatus Avalokitesvara rifleensis TaxID=3367620 RepID=UPI00271401C9|nr:hypothetical protein [Candidatus Brocadiales bacterium]
MAKKRTQRSDKELVNVSEHLLYEIAMLLGTALDLVNPASNKWTVSNANALIESFTIHARILLDFLYSNNPQPDDVIAEDFFDDASVWLEQRQAKTRLLTTIHKRVGKEVAHLTYARLAVTPEDKKWHFPAITKEIDEVLRTFLRLVPASRVSDSFREYISKTEST